MPSIFDMSALTVLKPLPLLDLIQLLHAGCLDLHFCGNCACGHGCNLQVLDLQGLESPESCGGRYFAQHGPALRLPLPAFACFAADFVFCRRAMGPPRSLGTSLAPVGKLVCLLASNRCASNFVEQIFSSLLARVINSVLLNP